MSISMSPQTSIKLCSVPWGDTTKHTLLFNDKTTQANYFNGLTGLTVDDYQYIRKDSTIKVGINIELLVNYNYCYYTNYQQSITDQGIYKTPKTYYCYITGREYVNENTTKLYVKTDVIQTYMTEILSDTTSISYINKQHINKNEDTAAGVRKYLIPENLETGEYIRTRQLGVSDMAGDTSTIDWTTITEVGKKDYLDLPYMIVAGCTQSILDTDFTGSLNRMYGGIYNGLTYYGFGTSANLSTFIAYLNQTAGIDALFNLFMVPIGIANWQAILRRRKWSESVTDTDTGDEEIKEQEYDIRCFKLTSDSYKIMDTIVSSAENRFLYMGYSGINETTDTNSYKPHNAKLYTYPYCYLQVLNGESGVTNYNIEYFDDPNVCNFNIIGTLSQGGSIVCYPKNYKGKADNFEDILAGPKFPTCSWNTDSYTNWLTQTAVSRSNTKRYAGEDLTQSTVTGASSTLIGLGSTIGNLAVGNIDKAGSGLSTALNGANTLINSQKTYDRTIDNLEEQNYVHSLVPDSINNGSACAEVLFSRGNYEFKVQLMTITGERAKQIDEYFDRFGYTVNRNANLVQAIKCRKYWNYVKTAECNIKADIPDEDLAEIKTIFNEGITFWKDANYFYKYNEGANNING